MTFSRRTLFAAAGVGLLGLAGCSVNDPRVSQPTVPGPQPTPTPTPVAAANLEQAVAQESALSTRAASALPVAGDHTAFVTAAQQAHITHVNYLATEFGPVDSPPPSAPRPASDLPSAVAAWTPVLTEVAADHREQAGLAAGRLSLTLSSCAAFAAVLSATLSTMTVTIGEEDPPEFTPMSDSAALGSLLAQLHAARYSYQTALGAFQPSDDRRKPLTARTAALETLRDSVAAALVSRGVEPPAAEPAYDVPRPTDPTAAIAFTAEVEQRLLPFIGSAVAAVTADDDLHPGLIDQVTSTTNRMVAAGGPLPRWPGW